MNKNQFARTAFDLRTLAHGQGQVFNTRNVIYYLGTELETLLLLKAYRFNQNARAEYSSNLKSSFFSLTLEGVACPTDFNVAANSAEVTEK